MEQNSAHDLASDHERRIWDILERQSVGMLTTRFPGGLRARPLDARPDRDGDLIFFLTDIRGLKDEEIGDHSEVCFIVIDADAKAYLSISGRGAVLQDPLLAARFWKKTDAVWWPGGAEDQNLRVLRIEPKLAELWDGPASKAVAAFEFAKARITRAKPDLGERRKVTVEF